MNGRGERRPPAASMAPRRRAPAAALYHRVSTLDQDAGAAGRELAAAARRLGLRVVLDVRETASGADGNRPGLARVMDAARRGDVDAVLVWKLDRFGRSALDLLGRLRELESAGVRFVAVTQGLDLRPGGDPMARLLLAVLSGVAEFEKDLIRERTRLGLARARARGSVLGRPRVERPPLPRVLELRERGRSWGEIAGALGCTEWAARAVVMERDRGAGRARSSRRDSSARSRSGRRGGRAPGRPPRRSRARAS
jgi:DNA invertase Pin-like site-specific DNA recombinase